MFAPLIFSIAPSHLPDYIESLARSRPELANALRGAIASRGNQSARTRPRHRAGSESASVPPPATPSGPRLVLSGYAAVYHDGSSKTRFYDQAHRRWEFLRPGCFDNALRDSRKVAARVAHDPSMRLGGVADGNLKLKTDARGLHYELSMPWPDDLSRRVYDMVARGTFQGSSFGYEPVRFREHDCYGIAAMEIIEADLVDVGPAFRPCYPTSIWAEVVR